MTRRLPLFATLLLTAMLPSRGAWAHEGPTVTVSSPPGAAAALQPVIAAFRSEGGGPITVLVENGASAKPDIIVASDDVMRTLERRQEIDLLFTTSFIYGTDREQYVCRVAASAHSTQKREAGLFLRFLADRAPGRIDHFLGGPVTSRTGC